MTGFVTGLLKVNVSVPVLGPPRSRIAPWAVVGALAIVVPSAQEVVGVQIMPYGRAKASPE